MMKQQRRPSLAERILVRRRGTSTDTSPNDRRPNSSSSSKVPTKHDAEKSEADVTPREERNPESLSIWRACQVGDLASVRYILATNPSVIHWMEPRKDDSTVVIGKYHTPLYYACRNGHTEIVQLLVEAGAQLDGSEILELAQSYQQNAEEVQERDRKTKSKTSKEATSNSCSSNDLEIPSPLVRTPSHIMIMSTMSTIQKALKKGPKRRKVQSRDSASSSTNKTKRSSNDSKAFEDSGYDTDAAYKQQDAGYKTEEGDDDDDDDVGLNKLGPSDTTAKILAALEQQDATGSRSQPTSDTVLSSAAIPLERKLSYLERLFHSHRRNNTNNTKKKKKKKKKTKSSNEDGKTKPSNKSRKKSSTKTEGKNSKITVGKDPATTIETNTTTRVPISCPEDASPVSEPVVANPFAPLSLFSWFTATSSPSSTTIDHKTPLSSTTSIKTKEMNQEDATTNTDTGCGCNLYSDARELLLPSDHNEEEVVNNTSVVQQEQYHDHVSRMVNFVEQNQSSCNSVEENNASSNDIFGGTVEEIGTEVKLYDEDGHLNNITSHHSLTTIILDDENNTSHKVTPKRSNIVATPRFSHFFPGSTNMVRSTSPTTVKPEISSPPTAAPTTNTENETAKSPNKTTTDPIVTEDVSAAAVAAATSTAMYPTMTKTAECDVGMVSTSDSDSDSMILEDEEDDDGSEFYDDDDSSGEYDSDGSYYSYEDDDDDDSAAQDDDEEDTLITITKGPQAGERTPAEPHGLTKTRSKLKSINNNKNKNVDDDDDDDPSRDVIKILYNTPSIIEDVKAEFCCMFIPIDDCSCFPNK